MRGAKEQIDRLISEVVAASKLPPAVKTQLLAQMRAALARFDPGKPAQRKAMCDALATFATAVRLLSGHGITAAQATQWIADANRIRAVIGCGARCSPPRTRRACRPLRHLRHHLRADPRLREPGLRLDQQRRADRGRGGHRSEHEEGDVEAVRQRVAARRRGARMRGQVVARGGRRDRGGRGDADRPADLLAWC